MHVLWFISTILLVYVFKHSMYQAMKVIPAKERNWPEMEKYHYPGAYTSAPSKISNGSTEISDTLDTPDFRIEEPDFTLYYESDPMQFERPYRNSPPYKQAQKNPSRWWFGKNYWREQDMMTGCYCAAVYRRLTILSTCAVITSRHILTTATPTSLILRSYSHLDNLENILGAWYDTNHDLFNTSMYATPARIHIHPSYIYDYQVNMSHPIPCMYDLAIWAATYPFFRRILGATVIICPRAASGWKHYTSSTPHFYDIIMVVGYMFMKAYHRRPMPWFRYVVKTQAHFYPCPKTDWHWFHCISGEYWGRYGFDSGGGMNTALRDLDYRHDGLSGICAFSMKLRSKQTTHYFTVVDNYPVLNYMYDAFLGLSQYVYLDGRFENTKWGAPIPFWGEHVNYGYPFGSEVYKYGEKDVPRYRR